MTAIETTATTARTAAEHEPHDHPASPHGVATRSAYSRMLGGFFHHVLHRPLLAYLQLVGAILASILHGCGATFLITMARQTCPRRAQRVSPNGLSAHRVRPARLACSTRPSPAAFVYHPPPLQRWAFPRSRW